MKIKKLTAIVLTAIMTFTVCIFALSPTATAILSKNGSISIHVTDSESKEPLPGAGFRLYFFASAHKLENGLGYEYVSPYEECKIGLKDLQDSALPVHLTYFAQTHSVPFTEKYTDANGLIVFEDLIPGIYLIIPVNNIHNYYMPAPFVINLPQYDEANKTWEYDISATPKMHFAGSNDTDSETYMSVEKIWETTEKHPDSVTVVLLRDLQEYDRVQLSEANNWHYRWDGLSKKYVWNIVEIQVPDGYMVKYETSANTVTIFNKPEEPDEETTTRPENESSPETTTDKNPESTTVRPPETTTTDKLVQTGQLNWPVPVFAIAGLLLFSIGWAMLNFGKKETD